ncbi:MAG: trypsin-like serine protease [Labilithrix sp.]|nr:trypsin-like serine protease [Labilithrix sp.]
MISSAFQRVLAAGSTRRCATALLPGLSALIMGCSAGAGSNQVDENVDQAIQPIIRGVSSGTEHDAVVVLTTFREGLRRSLCTATLVAPNLVITARHCVSDTESSTACSMDGTPIVGGGVKGDRAAGDLVVFLGKGGVAPDTEVEVNGVARGAKVVVDAASNVCNRDVAFVVLDRKLAAPVAPLRLGPPTMSETVSAVGWGIDETGTLPESREVRAGISLIGVGPAMYPDHATYGYGDSEFMIGESACAGDSGSPAFAQSGAVVGVAARAGNGKPRDPNNFASTCVGDTAHAVYTHLASMQELVARAFQESGEAIWLEGQPDPRAPKPEAAPEETKTSAPPATTTAGDLAAPAADDAPAATATGCSLSSEPQSGAVEYAAGFVALLASLLGLRRRLVRRDEPEAEHGGHRERLPSLP